MKQINFKNKFIILLMVFNFSFLNATWPTINLGDVMNKAMDALIAQAEQSMTMYMESTMKAGQNALADSLKNCISLDSMLGDVMENIGIEIELPCGGTFSMDNPMATLVNDMAGMIGSTIYAWVDNAIDNLVLITTSFDRYICDPGWTEDIDWGAEDMGFGEKKEELEKWVKDFSWCPGQDKDTYFPKKQKDKSDPKKELAYWEEVMKGQEELCDIPVGEGSTSMNIDKMKVILDKRNKRLADSIMKNVKSNQDAFIDSDPSKVDWSNVLYSDLEKTIPLKKKLREQLIRTSARLTIYPAQAKNSGGDSGAELFNSEWGNKMPTIQFVLASPINVYEKLYGTDKTGEKRKDISTNKFQVESLKTKVSSSGGSSMYISKAIFKQSFPSSSFSTAVEEAVKTTYGKKDNMLNFNGRGSLFLLSKLTDAVFSEINLTGELQQFYANSLYQRSQLIGLAILGEILEKTMTSVQDVGSGMQNTNVQLLGIAQATSQMRINSQIKINEIKNINTQLNNILNSLNK